LIFLFKKCLSNLKIRIKTTSDIHLNHAVDSTRNLIANHKADSPDIDSRRVAYMMNGKIRNAPNRFGEFWDQDTQKAIDYLKSVDYKTI
jgi:hypothetical protein